MHHHICPLYAGGFDQGTGTEAVPDWVDASVATWIETETAAMNAAWGDPTDRAALAFVHIPPYVRISVFLYHVLRTSSTTGTLSSHFRQTSIAHKIQA